MGVWSTLFVFSFWINVGVSVLVRHQIMKRVQARTERFSESSLISVYMNSRLGDYRDLCDQNQAPRYLLWLEMITRIISILQVILIVSVIALVTLLTKSSG